jgi:FXSXX-COOH protein
MSSVQDLTEQQPDRERFKLLDEGISGINLAEMELLEGTVLAEALRRVREGRRNYSVRSAHTSHSSYNKAI